MKKVILSTIVLISIATLSGCSINNDDSDEGDINQSIIEKADSNCAFESDEIIKESELSNYDCESVANCEWKLLGGKMESTYACCPKNLEENEESLDKYDRCFIIVD